MCVVTAFEGCHLDAVGVIVIEDEDVLGNLLVRSKKGFQASSWGVRMVARARPDFVKALI